MERGAEQSRRAFPTGGASRRALPFLLLFLLCLAVPAQEEYAYIARDERLEALIAKLRRGTDPRANVDSFRSALTYLERQRESDPSSTVQIPVDDETWRDAQEVLLEVFAAQPAPVRELWLREAEPKAEETLRRLRLVAGPSEWLEVARLFPLTATAQQVLLGQADRELEAGRFRAAYGYWTTLLAHYPDDEALHAASEPRLALIHAALGHDHAPEDDPYAALGRLLGGVRSSEAEPFWPGAEAWDEELPVGGARAFRVPVGDADGVYLADSKSLLALSPKLRERYDVRFGSLTSLPERVDALRFAPAIGEDRLFLTVHRNEPARFVGPLPEDHEADSETEAVADLFVAAVGHPTGVVLWTTLERTEWEEHARRLEHLSSPAVASGRVYAVGNQWENEVASHLFCFDGDSGALLFKTFLGSTSQLDILARSLLAPPPLAVDDAIFAATNNGSVVAVAAGTGRIHWSYTYPLASKQSQLYRQQRGSTPLCPLLMVGSTLVCFPRDSELVFGLDRHTGKRLWSLPKENMLREPLGGHGSLALFAGSTVLAVDARTGLVAWEAPGPRRLAGRGLVAAGLAYVPGTDALSIYDAGSGERLARFAWTEEQAGHLWLGEDVLYSASGTRISGFERLAKSERELPRGAEGTRRLAALRLAYGRLHEALALMRGSVMKTSGADRDLALAMLIDILAARAAAFAADGELERAAADLAEAASLATGERAVELYWQAGLRFEAAGQPAAALAAYQELTERFADRKLRLEGGFTVPVAPVVGEALQRLVAAQPDLYQAHSVRARELLDKAQRSDSAEALRAVVTRFPASREAAFAQFDLASFYMTRHAWADAIAEWRRFLRLFPRAARRADGLAGLAEAAVRGGFRETAEAALRRLRKEHPRDLVGASRVPVAAFVAELERDLAEVGESALPLPAQPLWTTGSDLGISRATVLRGASAFAVLGDDALFVRRQESGDLLWQLAGVASAALAEERVALFVRQGLELRELESGRLLWRFEVPPAATHLEEEFRPEVRVARLLFVDGRVILGTRDARIFAFDAETGAPAWERDDVGSLAEAGGLWDGHLLAFVLSPGRLVALDPTDGAIRRDIALPADAQRLSRPPQAAGGRVLCVAGGRRLLAYDADGTLAWSQTIEGRWVDRPVASADGSLVAVMLQPQVGGTQMLVLRLGDGAVLWQDMPGEKRIRALYFDPDGLYIHRGEILDGEVCSYDRDSGFLRWVYTVPVGVSHAFVGSTAEHLLLSNVAADGPAAVSVLAKARGVEVAQVGRLADKRLVAAALLGPRLVLVTDRGSFAFGTPDPRSLEERIALLLGRRPLPVEEREELASCYRMLGDPAAAVQVLGEALEMPGHPPRVAARLLHQMMVAREQSIERQTPVLTLRRVPRPAEIDGELTDWWQESEGIPLRSPTFLTPMQGVGTASRWMGAEDLSATMYLGWDERYFYLTLDVSDNILRPYDGEADSWIGDCLLIALDPQNNRGAWFRPDDNLLSLALTLPPKKKPDEEDEGKADGKFFVTRKDDNSGAIYEVRLAWQSGYFAEAGVAIGDEGPRDGFSFGFNLALTDDDHNRATKVLSLTPGLLLHTRKDNLWPGFVPKHFGTLRVEREEGRQP